MPKTITHDELQFIEHANKILNEHAELVKYVINETEGMLNTYVPVLKTYIKAIVNIRTEFSQEVIHIAQSLRELKSITGQTQELINFSSALIKLNEILTPELIEKLNKLNK